MNENDARRLLRSLAERVPVGRVPAESVAQRGREKVTRRRTRRRAATVLVAGVVVIGAAAFIPGLFTGDEPAPVAAQDRQGEEHSYEAGEAGTQEVGLGRVSVSVPATWTVGQPGVCLDDAVATVTASNLDADCTETTGGDPMVSVSMGPVQSLLGPREGLPSNEVSRGGLDLLVDSKPQCLGDVGGRRVCNVRAVALSADVAVEVSGAGPDFKDQASAILDSVRLTQADRVAVPPDLVGKPINQVRDTLRGLGFAVSTGGSGNQPFNAPTTEVGPAPGTVLDQGANVRIWYGTATNVDSGVDLQGQWTIGLVGSNVSTQISFEGFEVSIGGCGLWKGGHLITGDDLRFTDLTENETADGVGCDFEDAAEVSALLARVRHATGGGREVRLHLESYEIVATLRR